MNILYLNHNVVWRSTFHRCFLFARELVYLGHTVTIVTNSPSNKSKFHEHVVGGVRIVESPDLFWGTLRTGWDPVNVIRRCLYLRNKQFDLIHAFDTRPTVILPALYYKRFIHSVPLVIDWADWWGRGGAITLRSHKILNKLFEPIETFFEEYFRQYAQMTTVISELLKNRAESLGISAKTIVLLHNGVDTRSLFPINKTKARMIVGISRTVKVCVFSGYVLYDLQVVFKAFSLIRNKEKNALLLLLGNPKQYREALKDDHSKDILVIPNVTRSQLQQYLSASDVALLPLSASQTNKARFPLKLGDYIASEVPFISSDVGEVGSYCKAHKIAYYFASTPGAIAVCAHKIFSHPKHYSVEMKKYVQERLSYEKLAKGLELLYRRLRKNQNRILN